MEPGHLDAGGTEEAPGMVTLSAHQGGVVIASEVRPPTPAPGAIGVTRYRASGSSPGRRKRPGGFITLVRSAAIA